MLVAGLFDGNVAVFNLQKRGTKPNYISTAKNGKHQDTVWQVIRRSHLYYYHYILNNTRKPLSRFISYDDHIYILISGQMGQR